MTSPPRTDYIDRCEMQRLLFAPSPGRAELLALAGKPLPAAPCRLVVLRNQSFEFIASVLEPFMRYAGFDARVTYSDYDDSLSFEVPLEAEAVLVWLDFERYAETMDAPAIATWVLGRMAALRARTASPILLGLPPRASEALEALHDALSAGLSSVPGLHGCDQDPVYRQLGERFWDMRAMRLTGTRLGNAACIALARRLGFICLPALLSPRIKAIALDLDNTLYGGVLGEDGPRGLELSPAHEALHRTLIGLRERGVFLAIVSKNLDEDVVALFAERPDFPLRWEHLSARSVGWGSKHEGIAEIARALRIGPDAVLFVDDNPGELAEVAHALPGVRYVHAASPEETNRALTLFPGLHGYRSSDEDALRVTDLALSGQRAALQARFDDSKAYMRSLGVALTFQLNPHGLAGRLYELSQKTNQFNSGLRRFTEAEVAAYLDGADGAVVAIGLRDRLSDSGVIGAVFGRFVGRALVIDEISISCRALGRQIEDVLVGEALRGMIGARPVDHVRFAASAGPRNQPALQWLARFTGAAVTAPEVTWAWEPTALVRRLEDVPVEIRWNEAI
ncbi:MAG: HAD-IIIC family phosphatase [Candidatus Sericytochromatia bacterium]